MNEQSRTSVFTETVIAARFVTKCWLVLALMLGCSRTTRPTESEAAPAATSAETPFASARVVATRDSRDAAARDAGVPLGDGGEHAYEGKLGTSSRIAMELTRAGNDLKGSYRYVAVGTPIPLVGTIDAGGVMVLTEGAAKKPTGTLRLAPADGGADLTGEWTDPAGKKTFPVQLTHMRSKVPGVPTLGEQARLCLEDVACPTHEVERLYVAADDAHEPYSDCYRFIDGSGVPRDPARARACIERNLGECEGGSAFLGRALLATMRIDGVGGKVDIAGARALFANCFDDITKDAVIAHARDKEQDPQTPPLDFCEKGSGTTLTGEECAGWKSENERTRSLLASKAVVASLDSEGQRLFEVATRAYDAYVHSRVLLILDAYAGGSIRVALATGEQKALRKKRADDLATFSAFKAKTPSSEEEVTQATKKADAALAAAGRSAAVVATDTAWKAYRDAEISLYDHVFGAAQGHDDVRRSLVTRLATRRAAECAVP